MNAPDRFDTLPDGREVARVRIAAGDLEASILTWGATVQDLQFRGRRVVLGADSIAPYLDDLLYAGAIVGRFANRIGDARFSLEGEDFRTDPNFRGRHTLHGGSGGTGQRLWTLDHVQADSARLSIRLPDGDMGFPGTMDVSATYRIDPPGVLGVVIEARCTRATPCSFAHHGYFVLDDSGDVTNHVLRIAADHYLPVDGDLIPTGEIAPVDGTAFDFRVERPVGTAGYDHNFCLADRPGPLRDVAWLGSDKSGLAMVVSTTEPGLQVYDGDHLGGITAFDRTRLQTKAAIALEAQAWPDSPNRRAFPDCILQPGSVYRSETHYAFAKRDSD